MRLFMKKSVFLLGCGLLLSLPSSAQKPPSPKAQQHQPSMGRTQTPPPMSSAQKPAAPAVQNQHRVVVVEPVRVFDPYFDYPYAYTYSPDYMSENFGYIKLKTDRKDDAVYVDGGFVDKIEKAKKFALRPGNHDIEVRDAQGHNVFQKRVAVIANKTTELPVG